ncbi:MAG: transcriptional regulator [Bacteroidetes bacterium]|nr:transcriptional regulator [Bacteroidota bacterium]
METLKYKIITSEKQYFNYCKVLEELVFTSQKNKQIKEEIALLNLLIKKWDDEHSDFTELNPVELLKSLMKDHKMKAYQLANLLEVSEGLVSDMLSYKKGLSKESIRILALHFKLKQEAFNRPYKLKAATAKKTIIHRKRKPVRA